MTESFSFPQPVRTVGELRALLDSIPDETRLLQSIDTEGNEIKCTLSAKLVRTHPGYVWFDEDQLRAPNDPEALQQQMPLCLTFYPQD